MGYIIDLLGSAIHTADDIRFFREKEIDVLIKFVGKRIPKDPISETSKALFLNFCEILEVDSDDLEIAQINPDSPTAPDVFKFIYTHYHQLVLIPASYRLMCRVLYEMETDIELSPADKKWLKLFLENQHIDNPANWILSL